MHQGELGDELEFYCRLPSWQGKRWPNLPHHYLLHNPPHRPFPGELGRSCVTAAKWPPGIWLVEIEHWSV